MPAPIAVSVAMFERGVGVAVTVIVDASVPVLLGKTDPEVRLKITLPAGTSNGAVLPCVAWEHCVSLLVPELAQQYLLRSMGNIASPVPMSTVEQTIRQRQKVCVFRRTTAQL